MEYCKKHNCNNCHHCTIDAAADRIIEAIEGIEVVADTDSDWAWAFVILGVFAFILASEYLELI